jgi:hypothetical protein
MYCLPAIKMGPTDVQFVVATSALRVAIESALVGGVLGIFGGLLGTWLASSAQRKRDAERAATELKAASRLIDDELRNAYDAATAIKSGEPYVRLPISAWERERVRLAGAISLQDWETVKSAYDKVHGFNWRFEAGVLAKDAERFEACDAIISSVPPARQQLRNYTGA